MKKLIALFLLISCTAKTTESSLSPEEFNTKFRNTSKAILVDVRTEAEVKEGTLTGAQNIVYDDSFANKLNGLQKDIPIFVYCAKGKRSEKAAQIMKDQGFLEVYQLQGGLDAWKKSGLPM